MAPLAMFPARRTSLLWKGFIGIFLNVVLHALPTHVLWKDWCGRLELAEDHGAAYGRCWAVGTPGFRF